MLLLTLLVIDLYFVLGFSCVGVGVEHELIQRDVIITIDKKNVKLEFSR